ncbi:hypothetical protein PP175_23510 [Aneurinibacillus sp. Ricciae_BoGa-3]|uniref:hypothetical protein n=1 Tax=Aneurinibacillus sp. Ricciae_BoGa-3 TaxID=3022697 RepID=UPI0023408818|nr:hypothetical protein [Aneurinibacillus sp. Ricciae_BoGa-3]WCK54220.1 hypothetical protein PP175_23510 [Aneurinibacillus sp. Ricciae_BoGa-3]
MNSFTSNSRGQGPSRKWWMGGLAFAILFLVLCETLIFRNLSFYGAAPTSFIGQVDDLQKRLARVDKTKIKMVIFGDSESMDGLRPPLIAKQYGYKPDEVFNLSVSGGKPVDMLRMYELDMSQLSNVQKAIISVNEHHLNNSHYGQSTLFRYNATLGERLSAGTIEEKADLTFGWLLYAYGMRDVWTQMLSLYTEGKLPKPPSDQYAYRWGLPPVTAIDRSHIGPAYSNDVGQRWMTDYRMEGAHTQAMEKLVSGLAGRGIQLEFIQLPRTRDLESVLGGKYGTQQKQFRDRIQRMADQHHAPFLIIPPVLDNSNFRDANHLNTKGANAVVKFLH